MRLIICDNPNCDSQADLTEVEQSFMQKAMTGEDTNDINWKQFGKIHLCPKCCQEYEDKMAPVTEEWDTKRAAIIANLAGTEVKVDAEEPAADRADDSNVVNLFGGDGDDVIH